MKNYLRKADLLRMKSTVLSEMMDRFLEEIGRQYPSQDLASDEEALSFIVTVYSLVREKHQEINEIYSELRDAFTQLRGKYEAKAERLEKELARYEKRYSQKPNRKTHDAIVRRYRELCGVKDSLMKIESDMATALIGFSELMGKESSLLTLLSKIMEDVADEEPAYIR